MVDSPQQILLDLIQTQIMDRTKNKINIITKSLSKLHGIALKNKSFCKIILLKKQTQNQKMIIYMSVNLKVFDLNIFNEI